MSDDDEIATSIQRTAAQQAENEVTTSPSTRALDSWLAEAAALLRDFKTLLDVMGADASKISAVDNWLKENDRHD